MESRSITLHLRDILKLIGVCVALYIIYLIWDILLLLFVSLIFAALIDPFARSLARRRIPRGIAVLTVYVIFFGIVGLSIGVLAPVIAHDVPQVFVAGTDALSRLSEHSWFGTLFGSMDMQAHTNTTKEATSGGVLGTSGGALVGLFSTVSGFFGGLLSLLVVLVMTFYLVAQDDPLGKILRSVVPDQYIPYISDLFDRIQTKLGAWMRGQLLLSLAIGSLVTIGLSLAGVKYAAVLGLLAGILEFVPILGPIFAALPGLFFAFTGGGTVTFGIVLVIYIVIQQFENHILVPKVMQRAVGLNPVISIIAILIGVRIGGMVGAILAIPVATALSVVLTDVWSRKRSI